MIQRLLYDNLLMGKCWMKSSGCIDQGVDKTQGSLTSHVSLLDDLHIEVASQVCGGQSTFNCFQYNVKFPFKATYIYQD